MKAAKAWEWYGRNDPYFGVLTHPDYRAAGSEGDARDRFFAVGRFDVDWALEAAQVDFGAPPQLTHALDFGCGVGRLTTALAPRAGRVTAVDVSPSMLAEARRNADAAGLANIDFVHAPDGSPRGGRDVDFLISLLVFQHIPSATGLRLFREAVDRLVPGGVGVVEIPLAQPWRDRYEHRKGIIKEGLRRRLRELAGKPVGAPLMEMNAYDIDAALAILREAGCSRVVVRFRSHGPFHGAALSFRRDGG